MIMGCAIADRDPCEHHKCPTGSKCKVYEVTGETYCEASCDLDNGGCAANQTCSLQAEECIRAPCPPEVQLCFIYVDSYSYAMAWHYHYLTIAIIMFLAYNICQVSYLASS